TGLQARPARLPDPRRHPGDAGRRGPPRRPDRLIATTPAPATPFVALIPARPASPRLPDKPLADIGGQPMVVRVAERARAAGAQRVAIATDSERIADAVRAAGHEAVMTAAGHPSGTDRLAEAAR